MSTEKANPNEHKPEEPKPESSGADQEEIIFDNPKWAAGYKEGYKDGFDAGSARGYSKGYSKGYHEGYLRSREKIRTWGYVVAPENQREEGSE